MSSILIEKRSDKLYHIMDIEHRIFGFFSSAKTGSFQFYEYLKYEHEVSDDTLYLCRRYLRYLVNR